MQSFKCVVVGDGAVGKTCLLCSFSTGAFPADDYVPTVFNNMAKNIVVDGKPVVLTLWDTAGQEDYDRIRPCSYLNTDIFLVCFSINNLNTFNNVSSKWVPEITHHCAEAPFILLGTKMDLRDDPKIVESMQRRHKRGPITTEEGKQCASEVGAATYMECSALTLKNVTSVFEEAVRVTEAKRSGKGGKKKPGKKGKDGKEKDGCILA